MVFVSIRGRVLINAEALNMTESVGNYVKHRRVPVVSPKTYVTYFVPAISGESIAHGYQEVLAKKAERSNLPVCNLCKKGIFLKSTNNSVVYESFLERDNRKKDIVDWLKIEREEWEEASTINRKKEKNRSKEEKENLSKFLQKLSSAIEQAIIRDCLIEDIGGFMYAERNFGEFKVGGIKRTSCFSTGYMIPVKEAIESVVIDPQLHQRHALGLSSELMREQGQMIYYVELSSAPYVFSFDLDTRYIGRLTFSVEKAGEEAVSSEEIKKRKVIALDALKDFLIEMPFGAKRARTLPLIDWESIVIAVSDDVWTVPSPACVRYILNALKKLEKKNENTKLFVYINPQIFEETSVYVKKRTEELLNSFYYALEEFKELLEKNGDDNKIDWEEFKKKKLEEPLDRRVEELINSSDLRYHSYIQEKYVMTLKELEKCIREISKNKGDEAVFEIRIFDDFNKCVTEAIEEAMKEEGIKSGENQSTNSNSE